MARRTRTTSPRVAALGRVLLTAPPMAGAGAVAPRSYGEAPILASVPAPGFPEGIALWGVFLDDRGAPLERPLVQ